MRILISGFAAFLVWCVLSSWVINDIMLPVLNAPDPVPVIPENTSVADSLAKLHASMPAKMSLYFDFNKADLKTDQQTDSRIAEFKTWLDNHPGSLLLVTGHTDLVGKEPYNNDLALKRAQVAGKYIMQLGIGEARMKIESKGESEPAADYLTSDGRALNRRTEITIKLQ